MLAGPFRRGRSFRVERFIGQSGFTARWLSLPDKEPARKEEKRVQDLKGTRRSFLGVPGNRALHFENGETREGKRAVIKGERLGEPADVTWDLF